MERLLTKWTLMYSFAIAAWCISQAPFAIPADYQPENPVSAIRKLQPALSESKARNLLQIFVQTSARPDCQIPWQILASIAFHESSLGLHNTNSVSGDHSLMQINERTIARMKLNPARLMKDAAYAVQSACRVLRSNRDAYSEDRPYWLGIYRSGTRFSSPRIVRNAKSYARIVLATAHELGYRPNFELALAR